MVNTVVELEKIHKSFPGVKALDDARIDLRSGEVMALLGENGAGKSTLMKVLCGVHRPDSGTMRLFGKEISDLTPVTAGKLGISIIHQELNLCPHLTVAQNIFLGREIGTGGVLSESAMRAQTEALLRRLDIDISPDARVGDLPVSRQQMIEIAKALSTDAKILIMDEPTSALTAKEIDHLFDIVNRLKREGCGIIYISHRLDELKHIADRVTIMRDGKFVACEEFNKIGISEIISQMVGRKLTEQYPHIERERGTTIFEVSGLNAGNLVRDVSLRVFEGEILGIAGLMGAGRTETTRAIFGADPKVTGTYKLHGHEIVISNPTDAIRHGVVLVPEDRRKDGLCTRLSVSNNIALPNLDMLCNAFGVVKRGSEEAMVGGAIRDLSIRLSSPDVAAGTLSGGNQQKVVVGKWLARQSKVVIFDEPTRGIDVGAKVEIYRLMNELKRTGIGVVFVSSEMPEILGMSDRIVVMCDGRITGEFDRTSATQEVVLQAAMSYEAKV